MSDSIKDIESNNVQMRMTTDGFSVDSLNAENDATNNHFWGKFILFLIPIVVVLIVLSLVLIPISREHGINKDNVKTNLERVIKRGADLTVVKNSYDNEKENFILYSKSDKPSLYYPITTPLSEVLNDLQIDYYSGEIPNDDTLYLSRLRTLILENDFQNPFDKLEEDQVHFFKDLRFKLGDSYTVVQEDINLIVDALNSKNQLVNNYLKKAQMSYILSIIALCITILSVAIQLYQGNKNNKYLAQLYRTEQKEKQSPDSPKSE